MSSAGSWNLVEDKSGHHAVTLLFPGSALSGALNVHYPDLSNSLQRQIPSILSTTITALVLFSWGLESWQTQETHSEAEKERKTSSASVIIPLADGHKPPALAKCWHMTVKTDIQTLHLHPPLPSSVSGQQWLCGILILSPRYINSKLPVYSCDSGWQS